MSLKTLLLQHLLMTGANAAVAKLDGDPKTNAKAELKKGLFDLASGPVEDAAIDQLVDVVITKEHFGEDEARAEELLEQNIKITLELFELAHKHQK
jgi:hypothetical protein